MLTACARGVVLLCSLFLLLLDPHYHDGVAALGGFIIGGSGIQDHLEEAQRVSRVSSQEALFSARSPLCFRTPHFRCARQFAR